MELLILPSKCTIIYCYPPKGLQFASNNYYIDYFTHVIRGVVLLLRRVEPS